MCGSENSRLIIKRGVVPGDHCETCDHGGCADKCEAADAKSCCKGYEEEGYMQEPGSVGVCTILWCRTRLKPFLSAQLISCDALRPSLLPPSYNQKRQT
jgi:hypothetical protein